MKECQYNCGVSQSNHEVIVYALLKLGLSLNISAMGAWPCNILSCQRLMDQKCPRYRALSDITFSLEVWQIFKMRTVRKPDVFLPGCWTFNTFRFSPTCLAILGVRSCPVRKLICPVQLSPTTLEHPWKQARAATIWT